MKHVDQFQFASRRQPFGTWLLAQIKRDDEIGELARSAFQDSGFPRQGDFKAASLRLNRLGATPEMRAALEEAETDWLAL